MNAAADVAAEVLGFPGRRVWSSNDEWDARNPTHVAVFSANVCTLGGKVWYGDLDLTTDETMLVELARRLGTQVFVLFERDGRFEHEANPLLLRAVYTAHPMGLTTHDRDRMHRAADGTLRSGPKVGTDGE